MKPCIINAYSETKGSEKYFKSREPFKESFSELKIIFSTYPGNLERFMHIPDVLSKNQWYIFTDTDDVIMQSDVPDLHAIQEGVIVANEGEIHENSYWKPFCQNKFKHLLKKPIYNAGVFAMKGSYLLDFIDLLSTWRDKNDTGNVDQLIFNMFCHKVLGGKVYEHKTLFTTLYANMDKGLIEKKDKRWVTKTGSLITFVHANGSYKKYL